MKKLYLLILSLITASCVTPQDQAAEEIHNVSPQVQIAKKRENKKPTIPSVKRTNELKVWKTVHGKYETREYDEKFKMDLFHQRGFEIKDSHLINYPGAEKPIKIMTVHFKDQSGSTKIYDLKDSEGKDYVLYVKEQGRIDIVSPSKWSSFKRFDKINA